MLRLVRPAVGRPMMVQPRRGLMAKAMDPETLDAAIREMNQEMEDLFGSPVGSDARPSQPPQQHEVPSQRVVPSDVSAAVTAAPGSSAIDSATARSALPFLHGIAGIPAPHMLRMFVNYRDSYIYISPIKFYFGSICSRVKRVAKS